MSAFGYIKAGEDNLVPRAMMSATVNSAISAEAKGPSRRDVPLSVVSSVANSQMATALAKFFLWVASLYLAVMTRPFGVAVVFGLVGAMGLMQVFASWNRPSNSAPIVESGIVAFAVAITSLFGVLIGSSVAVGGIFFVLMLLASNKRSFDAQFKLLLSLVSVVLFELSIVSLSKVPHFGLWPVVALFILVSSYDAGKYIMAAESRSVLVKFLGGTASLVSATVVVAALMGVSYGFWVPWRSGILVLITAPFGMAILDSVFGRQNRSRQAMARVSSFLLAAPALWVYYSFFAR